MATMKEALMAPEVEAVMEERRVTVGWPMRTVEKSQRPRWR